MTGVTPRWISYLRLMRLSGVFTALADAAMGFMLIAPPSLDGQRLAGLCLASAAFYLAGMALNDYFDLELDRRERPERPLPRGEIRPPRALSLGIALIGLGVVSGNLAGALTGRWISSAGCVAVGLANLIVFYDRRLKATPLGPLAMGGCRALNVWMGASVGLAAQGVDALPGAWPVVLVMSGIGIYVAGITWFARDDAGPSDRRQLAMAAVVMFSGLVLIAAFPYASGLGRMDPMKIQPPIAWPVMLGILAAAPARRWMLAWREPQPEVVRVAVKQSLLFLIVLDAAIVLACQGPWPAIAVLGLLLPAVVVGQWIAVT